MKKWNVFIVTVFITQTALAADIPATLQWSQRVELSTPVSGTVYTVNVEAGENVKKGQVLLSLDGTLYQARIAESQSEISRLKAEAEEDKRDLDRVLELHARTVVSTTELDQAKLNLTRSESLLAEAKARLRQNQKLLYDTSLRAPFDAIVILRQAEPGQSIAAGLQPQMLLTLGKAGEMIARMHLPADHLDKLKIGQQVTVTAAGNSFAGTIKTLGLEPETIQNESSYPVDVLFSSKVRLRAGIPALVKIP